MANPPPEFSRRRRRWIRHTPVPPPEPEKLRMAKASLPFSPPLTAGIVNGRLTVNIAQAQARAGVSRRTIYNWMKAGKVEYLRTAGGMVRIFEDSLWKTAR